MSGQLAYKAGPAEIEFCKYLTNTFDSRVIETLTVKFLAVRDEILQRKAAAPVPERTNDDQIKHMVNRFLTWRLPENFHPDAGISFNPTFNENTPHPMKHEPVGTNLFDYTQAEEMIRYMVNGIPLVLAAPVPQPEPALTFEEALDNFPAEPPARKDELGTCTKCGKSEGDPIHTGWKSPCWAAEGHHEFVAPQASPEAPAKLPICENCKGPTRLVEGVGYLCQKKACPCIYTDDPLPEMDFETWFKTANISRHNKYIAKKAWEARARLGLSGSDTK